MSQEAASRAVTWVSGQWSQICWVEPFHREWGQWVSWERAPFSLLAEKCWRIVLSSHLGMEGKFSNTGCKLQLSCCFSCGSDRGKWGQKEARGQMIKCLTCRAECILRALMVHIPRESWGPEHATSGAALSVAQAVEGGQAGRVWKGPRDHRAAAEMMSGQSPGN